MAKFFDDSILNAALAVADNATTMHVCTGQPANHAGIAAVSLGSVSLAGGDYTTADDTSGRKLTIASKTITSASASGTATHIAGTDGTTLLWVTTCTSQAITSGNPVTVPSFKLSIPDPT